MRPPQPAGRLPAGPGKRQPDLLERAAAARPVRVPRFLRAGQSRARPVERRTAGAAAARHGCVQPLAGRPERFAAPSGAAVEGRSGRRRRSSTALASALGSFLERDALRDPAFAALVLTQPGEAEIAQEIAADVDPDAVHARPKRPAPPHRADQRGHACGGSTTSLRIRPPTAPTRQAPAGAPCATSRSTCWPLPITTRERRLAVAQFDARHEHDGPACGAQHPHDHPGTGPRGRRWRGSGSAIATSRWSSTNGSRFRPPSRSPRRWRASRRCSIIRPFALSNPNRVRSLVGSFAMANQTQFNRADGAGYRFVADDDPARRSAQSAARGAPSDGLQLVADDGKRAPRSRRNAPCGRSPTRPACRATRAISCSAHSNKSKQSQGIESTPVPSARTGESPRGLPGDMEIFY